jgi:diguanylate cyclase (GGDEF)-like protein/PAS domain S-box-containing protein
LYVVSGVCAYAAVQQLWIWRNSPEFRDAGLLFGASLLWAISANLNAQSLQATAPADYVRFLRYVVDCAIATGPLICAYFAKYTSTSLTLVRWVLVPATALAVVANHLMPETLLFRHIDELRTEALPWGETITRARGESGPWAYGLAALAFACVAYSLLILAAYYKRAPSRTTAWLLAGLAIFALCAFEGIVVRLAQANFVGFAPFGFVAIIVTAAAAASSASRRRIASSEARFRLLFDHSPQATFAVDAAAGTIAEVNESAVRMLGYAKAELMGKPFVEILRPQDAPDAATCLERMAEQAQRGLRRDQCYARKDGSLVHADCSIVATHDAAGRVEQFIVSASDITERLRSEEALRASEIRFRSIFEQSPWAISCSRSGTTLAVNTAMLRMFGYTQADEVIGTSVLNRVAPQSRSLVEERLKLRDQGLAGEQSFEIVGQRKDGTQFPVLVSGKIIELADGPASFAFLVDISERKQAEERVKYLAYYDQLTRLANRQLFTDRARQALALCGRNGRYGAVLLVDLDDFKGVNDTRGHAFGDELLREIAARLSSLVPDGDSVARLGGDEFVVLIEELSEREEEAARQAEAAGEKILLALSRPFAIRSATTRCSCSIGVTLFRDQHLLPDDLIRQADIAMYEAKRAGRNQLRFFDPRMQEMIQARVVLEADLMRAIEGGQFVLHYQVQVDGSYLPIGAEALIRWQHPERGLLPPGAFIPAAEENGLIVRIGQWVLDTACAQLAKWRNDALTRDLVLAINVSSKQFRKKNFVDQVRDAVQRHGVRPSQLKFELTESTLVEDIEETIATMSELKRFGIRFSLDDFGTGCSSLQYLKRLPLDQLKIDQSFVQDITHDANDRAIIRTIVAMAQSLNVDVIAEGVESEEQRNLLFDCGCQHFQGYLFGRPVPAEDLGVMVEASLIGFQQSNSKTPGLRMRR